MKKIYSLIGALVVTSVAVAQETQRNPFETAGYKQRAVLSSTSKLPKSKIQNGNPVSASKTSSPTFSLEVEPIGDIMTNKNLTLDGSASADQDLFLSPIFMDSTVRFSYAGGNPVVNDITLGTILDPKSPFLQASFNPIVDPTEGYVVNSVWIPGSYVKVTPTVDTLYTWIVWGDTVGAPATFTNPVFRKEPSANLWISPLADWRPNTLGPRMAGMVGASGNKVYPSAPSTNQVRIKYVLTPSDSVMVSGRYKYINVIPSAPITIPANNVVSCFYTFVPGVAYANNTSNIYSFSGASVPQNVNGFAAIVWQQNYPTITAAADYQDHQNDPGGWNMGTNFSKPQRHAKYNTTYRSFQFGDPTVAPAIVYDISGPTSIITGINKYEADGFGLSQNIPNPFTKESIVRYNLKSDVNSAVFTVTDVMGRVISTENVGTTAGTHTVNLNSYAAGVYYYSLNVDGKVTTKKMIVE